MIKKVTALLLILNLYAFGIERGSLGLNVNTNDLEIDGKVSLAALTNNVRYENFFFDINWISNDSSLLSPGFYVQSLLQGSSSFIFGFGIKSVFANNGDLQFTATPLMLTAKIRLIPRNFPPTYISAKWLYAPGPLTFQDAKRYLEYRVEFNTRVIESVELYLGYRNIDTDYIDTKDKIIDINYNRSMYAGFRFLF